MGFFVVFFFVLLFELIDGKVKRLKYRAKVSKYVSCHLISMLSDSEVGPG